MSNRPRARPCTRHLHVLTAAFVPSRCWQWHLRDQVHAQRREDPACGAHHDAAGQGVRHYPQRRQWAAGRQGGSHDSQVQSVRPSSSPCTTLCSPILHGTHPRAAVQFLALGCHRASHKPWAWSRRCWRFATTWRSGTRRCVVPPLASPPRSEHPLAGCCLRWRKGHRTGA